MSEPETIINSTLINYTGQQANWGCQATSKALLAQLDFLLKRTFPHTDVCFSTIPLVKKSLTGRLLGKLLKNFLTSCYLQKRHDLLTRQILKLACRIIYRQDFVKVLNADIVFFQAEGTMSGKNFTQGNRLFLLPYYAKVILGKPVVSLNQTLFSSTDDFKEVIRSCYSLFDIVAVRESASLKFAHEIGISNAFLLPDAAFNITAPDTITDTSIDYSHQKYFCITGSESIQSGQLKFYTNIAEYCMEQYGLHALFLLSGPGDTKKLQPYAENWKLTNKRYGSKIHILSEDVTMEDIVAILKKSTFLIGGRYHMAILSANVGTPIILFPPRTHKTEGLISMLNYPLDVCNPNDELETQQQIDLIMDNYITYKNYMINCRKNVRQLEEKGQDLLFEKLSTIASGLNIT